MFFNVIAIIIILLYTALNIYTGKKMILFFKTIWPKFNNKIFWIFYTFIFLSFFIGRIVPKWMASKYIIIIGSVYLGIFFYLIILLLIVEVLKILLKLTKKVTKEFFNSRSFIMKAGSIVTIAVIIVTFLGLFNGMSTIVVNYNVKVDKTVDDMKKLNIVMISDIHMGNIVGEKRVLGIIKQIENLNPDMVLISGDIFDGDYNNVNNIDKIEEAFKSLKTTYGTYACLGNHDIGSTLPQMIGFCKNAGITLLQDEYILVDDKFIISGRRDKSYKDDNGMRRKSMDDMLDKIPADKPLIMLDHQPSAIEEAKECGVDLLLCGHTHRGQLFPINIITKAINIIDYGQMTDERFNAVVSCGVGTWGPPMRIGSRSEITNIEVTFD